MNFRNVIVLTFVGALFLLPRDGAAKIYKYVDENGSLVFVDDETRIPPESRPSVTSYSEELDHLSPEERGAVLEERRRARENESELERQKEQQQKEQQRDQSAKESLKNSLRTRVSIQDNSVLIPVEVSYGGKSARLNLLLDTGAQMTVIHADAVARLDVQGGKLGLARGVGGYAIPFSRVKFRTLRIGPFEERDIPISVLENRGFSSHDGLLGMDFIMKHPYRVDYDNQMILWE